MKIVLRLGTIPLKVFVEISNLYDYSSLNYYNKKKIVVPLSTPFFIIHSSLDNFKK